MKQAGTVEAAGYGHQAHAESLAEYGTPVRLAGSGGWLLDRVVPGTALHDGMGCYPLFVCRDWQALGADMDDLSGRLVSVCLVTDPFGDYDAKLLRDCFSDVVTPFKQHFVVDLQSDWFARLPKHHLRHIAKAEGSLEVRRCPVPIAALDDWVRVYDVLTVKHGIRGMLAFSRSSFEKQLQVPGIVAYQAVKNGQVVGMTLWYRSGDVVYYHLGAQSDEGYAESSSYQLFRTALFDFAEEKMKWAGPGWVPALAPMLDVTTVFPDSRKAGQRALGRCISAAESWTEKLMSG